MKILNEYLKHLYFEDLFYGALGGLIGALLGVFLGNASLYQVSAFTLFGMVFAAFLIARRRIADNNSDRQ